VTVTHELKTVALQQVMAEHKWDALITGIRRDEDPTRAKERYFSPRTKDFEWDYKDQPPEFWNQFTTSCAPGEHVRVQALLDWSERDIWLYIQREGSRFRKCTLRGTAVTENVTASVRLVAGRSQARWKVTRTRSIRSSTSWRSPRQ
jgi:3'-phosphoadenosine 5'-phosphosulfate sulfotransferase (PAPS reductase)/FAD synthetase